MSKELKDPIIWALYDDGNGSWHKLGAKNVYSFGLNDHPDWDNYFKVDLSATNLNLIQDLEKVAKITGKPDFIIAHPPCESWSIADNQRRVYRDIKLYKTPTSKGVLLDLFNWRELADLNIRTMGKKQPHLYRNPAKQIGKCLIGMGTATAVKCIIEHFQPHISIIENPQTSKLWDFLYAMCDMYGSKELTYYNKWDNEYTPKPTFFMFNYGHRYFIHMLNEAFIYFPEETSKYTPNKKTLTFGRSGTVSLTYDQKSSVPEPLIEWIYEALYCKWKEYNSKLKKEEVNE